MVLETEGAVTGLVHRQPGGLVDDQGLAVDEQYAVAMHAKRLATPSVFAPEAAAMRLPALLALLSLASPAGAQV
ncbi:hypothetical protein SAQ01S_10440 [Sphingomonas aquatilis NBRC 16722]|nr:hypothetical protein SAQ01S_10440 [Sphingomonas aquatilis NBRC 16722]